MAICVKAGEESQVQTPAVAFMVSIAEWIPLQTLVQEDLAEVLIQVWGRLGAGSFLSARERRVSSLPGLGR